MDRARSSAHVISFASAAAVIKALRLRAAVDHVPIPRLRAACRCALSVLDQGRSNAMAVAEGVRVMRPARLATPATDGAA